MTGKAAIRGLRAGIVALIEQLAAPTATPGGGSAAAASGAMAAALAGMVASMSRGKKAYLQHEAQLSEAIARLVNLREELKSAIDADAESYNVVMKAYKSAKESPDAGRIIADALKQATNVPLNVAEHVVEVARIAATLRPITNPNMSSDLTTAIALARAALEGALANVQINLDSIKLDSAEDEAFVTQTRNRAAELKSKPSKLRRGELLLLRPAPEPTSSKVLIVSLRFVSFSIKSAAPRTRVPAQWALQSPPPAKPQLRAR